MAEQIGRWNSAGQSDDASPPTLGDVVTSAFGYFLVAPLCSLAGYAVAHHTGIPRSWHDWGPLLVLWALLVPAYILRAALYEGTKTKFITRDDLAALRWQKKISWEYAIASALFVMSLLFVVWLAGPALAHLGYSNPRLLIQTFATVAPLYVICIYLGIRWPRDPQLFDFRFRNFFPALATCLSPFVFGHEVGGDLFCSIFAAALVLTLWTVGIFVPTKRFATTGFVILLILIIALPLHATLSNQGWAKCFILCTFGLLLTLAMGVCEAWRFTARVLNDKEYRPDGNFNDATKRYYLGGANLATALFLPIFLWTAFHPATTRLYLPAAFVVLTVQYVLWYFDRTDTKRTWWPEVGAVIGYLYPVVVGVGTSIDHWPSLGAAAPRTVSLFEMCEVWAFCLACVAPLVVYSGLWDLRHEEQKIPKFQSFILCAGVTGFTSITLGCFSVGLMFLSGVMVDDPPKFMLTRGVPIAATYLVVGGLCTLAVLYGRFWSRSSPERLDVAETNPPTSSALRYATLILKSGRLPSAVIASVMTAVSLVMSGWAFRAAVPAGAAILFATLFGFIVNDIIDFDKDRQALLQRPIATGVLPRKIATIGAACTAITALGLGFTIGGALPILGLLLALVIYTPFAHTLPALKGAYTAFLCMSPLLYAISLGSSSVSGSLLIGLGIFIIGRELMLDLMDRDTDAKWGLRTLAVRLGESSASSLGSICMFLGLGIVMCFVQTTVARSLSLAAIVSLAIILRMNHLPMLRRAQLSRLTMLFGALAVALSVTA